jgi:hypothetical protein
MHLVTPIPRALRVIAPLVLAAIVTVSEPLGAEIVDRVLAVAAGELITLSDVRGAIELGLVEVGGAPDPVRAALSRLIERALILDEVNRYAPPEPTAAAVDARVAALRSRFADAAAFEAALRRSGFDAPRLREVVRENLRIQAYLAQRFAADSVQRSQTAVTDWVAGLRRRTEVVDLYEVAAP